MNSIPHPILGDLGALHRSSTWENLALNVGLSSKGIIVPTSSRAPAEESPSLNTTIMPITDGAAAIDGSGPSTTGNASAIVGASQQTTEAPSTCEGPWDWNASALKHITQGIPNALAPFFQGMLLRFEPIWYKRICLQH